MIDNMSKEYVIGVDIGGQSAMIGIVDRRANILARSRMDTKVYGEADAEKFMDDLCANIRKISEQVDWESIEGIGIGAPNGNYYQGTIEGAANLPWGKGVVPLRDYIAKKTGKPVTVTNDANAAAIGEMHYGNAKGMTNFIEITLGTGVGSGIVVNGQMVYGHDGFAGELGHTTAVRHNGRQCNCGKVGCLETYASAIGVARTAREWLDMSDEPSLLRSLEVITSKDVYDAAVAGDAIAKKVFEFTGQKLGESFADFVAFSTPEAIILFGGLAEAGDLIMKPLVEAMEANLLSIWKGGKIKVLRSGLKESDAAILGAGALAW
ncbi:MAG TPA: ROK family protein [Bacteroidales bacterium]|jgi:glucokinase|nr:ROK family protein [Bacteroidales bacterium]HPK29827.1 ROK family protein [Bacteroidales bacterium]